MYCPKCGIQNPDDAKFCTRCGTPLRDSSDKSFSPDSEQPEPQTGSEAPAGTERHGFLSRTSEEPYQIDRQVLQIMDEYGYEEEWSFYDLVSLEEKDEAHAAINASLNEDYQAHLDYSEKVTGKTVDEIRDSTNAKDYNGVETGVTNIENGILSIKYKDMIMEGDVTGTWFTG